MFGGQIELIALLGQGGQFLVRAEIVGRYLERLLPARDACGERPVDILKGLFGGVLQGRLAGFADPIEDAARLGLLLGFIAQERVFERHVLIGGIEAHGFAELIARSFVFSDLQQRVGQILADGGAVRGERNGLAKAGDGLVVAFVTQRLVGTFERLIGGIRAAGPRSRLKARASRNVIRNTVYPLGHRASGDEP